MLKRPLVILASNILLVQNVLQVDMALALNFF